MAIKIFVGRLSEGTLREDIMALFCKYGEVVECDVLSNYGFVHMGSSAEAQAAIDALDGFNVRGSRIHVELSTARTQGRKRKSLDAPIRRSTEMRSGARYDPYPLRREDSGYRPGVKDHTQQQEEYASEQVKDLLELYFHDPVAFDQYAKTYYYGEHLDRVGRNGGPPPDMQQRPSSYSKPSTAPDRDAYEMSSRSRELPRYERSSRGGAQPNPYSYK